MLSLRSTSALRAPAASRRAPASRRVAVPVRAGVMDDIAKGFMSIFSPPKDDAPNGWQGTTNSFSGRIDHHGAGRPFKDGFAGGKADPISAAAAAAQEVTEPGYVEGAIKDVMGKNFAGKEDAEQPSTGAEGWQGDIHGRKRDGFHAPLTHSLGGFNNKPVHYTTPPHASELHLMPGMMHRSHTTPGLLMTSW
ncbi:MAG: hypothetical protein J3K34DRAFT_211827 [Monoraphidium minutum]|nr:MAG: hypothetical protein J3K34DRAFT_211827 [Monoraphidium minutum]